MSENSEEIVLTGPWYDYNGTTIWDTQVYTLKIRHFGFLNNFLVLFFAIVAERFWAIMAYGIHQSGSHNRARDGMRRSMEVFIRNSSALDVFLSGWKILVRWRNRSSKRTWYKCLSIYLTALTILVLFQMAGVYVSMIKLGTVVRLKSSDTCGMYAHERMSALNSIITNAANDIATTLETVRSRRNLVDSTGYALKELLPFLNITTIDCPFDETVCKKFVDDPSMAIGAQIDSGHMSIRALGINSPEDLKFRRINRCAILSTEGPFKSITVGLESSGEEEYDLEYLYNYGGEPILTSEDYIDDFVNLTYIYSGHDSLRLTYDLWGKHSRNLTRPHRSHAQNTGSSGWAPIPELKKKIYGPDIAAPDVSILFIDRNAVHFSKPNYDPLYYATYQEGDAYFADVEDRVSVVACTQEAQVCNTLRNGTRFCAGPHSLSAFQNTFHTLELSSLQESLLKSYVAAATQWWDLGYLAQIRRESLLLADHTHINGDSKTVRSSYWQLELQNMMAYGIVGTMYELRAYASGKSAHMYKDLSASEVEEVDRLTDFHPNISDDPICANNYVVVDAPLTHVTFRLVPIIIILVFGSFIIILSLVLEPILSAILYRYEGTQHATLVWKLDNVLQLFRFTMEAAGVDSWDKGLIGTVPLTGKKELMAVDVESGGLLRFGRPITQFENVETTDRPVNLRRFQTLPLAELDSQVAHHGTELDSQTTGNQIMMHKTLRSNFASYAPSRSPPFP